jgi:hypothetical protein
MIFPGPVAVLPELYVQHPVLLVFDAPMLKHALGKPFQIGERAEIIAALYRGFIADDSRRLHPSDRRQTFPLRFLFEPVDPGTEPVAANFEADVVFSTVSWSGRLPAAISVSSQSLTSAARRDSSSPQKR